MNAFCGTYVGANLTRLLYVRVIFDTSTGVSFRNLSGTFLCTVLETNWYQIVKPPRAVIGSKELLKYI
jgi:hypothetical protein